MKKNKWSPRLSCALTALTALVAASASGQQDAAVAPRGAQPQKPVLGRQAAPAPRTPRDNSKSISSMFPPGPPKAPPPAIPFDPSRPAAGVVGNGNGNGHGGVQDDGITLLDFEAYHFDDADNHDIGTYLYEDGFIIAEQNGDAFPFHTFGSQESRYPGSTAIFNDTIGGTTYVYSYDFAPFSLEFMEFANLNQAGPVSITVHGVKYDGSEVTRTCTTLTSDNREETYYFSGFNDLFYIYWTQDFPYHQFDNIGIVKAPIIMDFQSLEVADADIHGWGSEYYENGFVIDQTPGAPYELSTFGTLEGRYPGSTALFDRYAGDTMTLRDPTGGTFDVHSIDLSNLNNNGPCTVKFVGTRPDGFQVTKSFKTSGSPNGLETFIFTGFNYLSKLEWTQDSPYHQFDNIVLSRGQQTLDFITLAQGDDQAHDVGTSYRQDGFRITKGPNEPFNFETFGYYSPQFPGSASLFNNTIDGLTHIETIDDTLFQAIGIEIAPLNSPDPVTVNFTGHKSDGSEVNQSFTTSGNQIRLETFQFPGNWRGLKDIEWTQDYPFHQFDNVRLVRQTTLVDFQKLEHVDNSYVDVGDTYAEEGFRLTKGKNEPFPFAAYGTLSSNYNGSTSIFNNTIDGLIRLSCVDGGDFDLLQMDLSTLASGLGDTYVTFTGTKTDGSQVFQSFNVEDAYLTQQTVRFQGFESLKYVDWTQSYPFHQIDNIVAVESVQQQDCYADCDGNGVLDLFDFLCFVNAFNANKPYANCDGNGALDLFDFLCYVNAFNAGC